jgi:polyhydroxybutyrate depolymerase
MKRINSCSILAFIAEAMFLPRPAAIALGLLLVLCGCGGGGESAAPPPSAPAVITAFGASPASVTAGQSATLSWSVTGASSLSISGGVGSVTGLSSRSVTPTATTTYVLTATNSAGSSVTASATVTVTAAVGPYPAGLSLASIPVGSVTRQFRVHVPAGLTQPPKAVVLVLHGGGGEGMDVALTGTHPLSVFRTVADREGFVVVYPGGLPAMDGNPGWDDCRGDNLMASGADDIGFLDALIARLRAEYGLPASRVFLSGGSNGAQMVLGYAIARAENFEAIAVGNGNLPLNPKPGACSAPPARRFPVLMTHGTADVPMPYGGGCVANLGGACSRGRVVSAEATRDYWLQANGLAAVTPSLTTVNVDPADAGPANRFLYAGTQSVEWWRLDGAGHPAPSRTVLAGNAVSGPQNRDVEFAELAWSFFAARLPASAPPAVSGSGAYTITRSIGTAALSVPAIVDKPIGDSLDVMLLFHGSVGLDSLVLDAARNTLDAFGALFDRRDLLLVSVAYPEEGLLMGDNVRHAEAALQWVRDSAARELGINVRRVFLAGHSQGGYIVTRLNTQYTVDGVIASAPGPLDLVYRCGLEEDGRLAAGAVCSLLRQTYGSTSAASQSYRARSLLEFTGNQRSPLLVIQGQADSPIQMANWPLFRQQLEACTTCAARTILELPGLGHPALFTSAEAKRTFNEFLGPLRRVN